MDPWNRTYRQLQHMADGRQKAEWARTAAVMMGTVKAFTGAGPKLIDLIPKRYRQSAGEVDEEQEEANAELAFAELEAGLRAMSRARREQKIAGFEGFKGV